MQTTNKQKKVDYYSLVVTIAREQNDQRLTYQHLLELLQKKLQQLIYKGVCPTLDLLKLKQAWREFSRTQNIVLRRI